MPALKKKRANFALHAPDAEQVAVVGTFNNWDAAARPLKRDSKGMWRTWMNLAPGTYEYLFVVDGAWVTDPNCSEQVENPYGAHNSVLAL